MEVESKQEGIAVLLASRTYLYRLLQSLFGNEPTLKGIEILNSDYTETALSLLTLEKSSSLLRSFSELWEQNQEKLLEQAGSEYTRLFIGPTKLPAPPWESVYVTEERLIFQESTLRVRQCYLKYNFLPAHYRSEADDHIALELDFMYNLCSIAETAFQAEDMSQVAEVLLDQKAFLEEHLLVWTPQYIKDLQAATSHPLYQGLAFLLDDFLKTDFAVIEEILTAL